MRLLTKEQRNSSRYYQFNKLIEDGYNRETYKGLDFFTKNDGKYFTLKVFRGNAANHCEYVNYRTEERRTEVINTYKSSYDRNEAYKAEQKEKYKGKKSSHAGAAAAIKSELQNKFPGIKFSCTSDSFSMGDSVHISWTDGPTTKDVEAISGKYQYGQFNGMEDIYEYTNSREDIPQAKYVQEHRSMSDEAEKIVYDALLNQYGKGYFENLDQWEIKRRIYQKFAETDFCPTIEPTPEKPTTTPEPEAGDKIQIVDYSEKAFAVIGNFSAHYDNLIKLGGAYNSRLKCGRGIIFSKKKLEEVKEYLIAAKGENKEPKQQQRVKL